MLQSIRDRTQGWIAGVIISLVILSFALWGIHSYMVGSTNTSTIAKVNGVAVTKTQLNATYERLRRQMQNNANSGSGLSGSAEAQLKQNAFQYLISMEVLKQASIDAHYHITSSQVDNFLENMPAFQVNGQFSMERFNQILALTLYSPGEFLDEIKTTLLIDQPKLGLLFSSFALPDEVDSAVALVNQERDIDYLLLPRDAFLKEISPVTEDEINAYYKQNQNLFKSPETLSIDYLELSAKDLMAQFTPTEAEMQSFYNENVSSFTVPMQWNLEKILIPLAENATSKDEAAAQSKANDLETKIHNGTDFASLAREYPDTSKNGKELTWVMLNQVSPELQKAVSALTKLGQVSAPIRTSNGMVILKVTGVKEAQVQPFNFVKDKVKEALARQQAEEKFAEMRDKLSSVTYEHPDSLVAAAKSMNLTIKSSPMFTRDKGADVITDSTKVRDAAFSDDVLNAQNNSDLIQVSPDTAVVLRVKSHVPASVLPLDTVKKQIVETITTQKAESKAEALANDIKQKLAKGATPEQITQEYHYNWTALGFVGRYSTKADSAILFTAFRQPRTQSGKTDYADVKTPNGFAVVATKAVRDGNASNHTLVDAYAEQVQNREAVLEYKLYEQSLINKAKIVSSFDNQDKQPI